MYLMVANKLLRDKYPFIITVAEVSFMSTMANFLTNECMYCSSFVLCSHLRSGMNVISIIILDLLKHRRRIT